MNIIPFVPIQQQELQNYLRIMERGNRLIKNWSEKLLGKRKRRTFRQMLFNDEICIEGPSFCLMCEHLSIPRSDYEQIMAVRVIEWDMLCGFSPLAISHANIWNSRVEDDLFEDLAQTANMALLDAIYGYIPARSKGCRYKRANFMTYAWRVISRRLRREIENHQMPLLPPSGDGARELVRKFEHFRRHYNDHLTFDAATELMGLNAEQQHILSCAMANVMRESEMRVSIQDDCDYEDPIRDDYTCFASDLNVDAPVDSELVKNVQLCVKLANLSDFQKDLLVTSQTPYHGWKAEVAQRHGRTRQAATQAFRKACDLVRQQYYEKFGEDADF